MSENSEKNQQIYRFALPAKVRKLLFTNKDFIEHTLSFKKDPFYVPFPKVDQYFDSTNNCFRLDLALAGYNPDDINIDVDLDTYTITIFTSNENSFEKQDAVDDDKIFIVKSIAKRSFLVSFFLDNSLDLEKIEARMVNGLLEIFVPQKKSITSKLLKVNIKKI